MSEDELEEVDRFLAGDTLYKTRQAKVEKKLLEEGLDNTEEQYEDERRKTLSQFFSVSATAFELSKPSPKKEESSLKKWFKGKMELLTKSSKIAKEKTASWYKLQELLQKNKLSQEEMQEKERLENIVFTLRPWKSQTTTHEAFLSKVERNIKQEIETPKTELTGSLFRRGMEFLRKNMPFDSLPEGIQKEFLALDSGEKTLREALQIDKCKAELEEVRKFGDRKLISYKEQEITDKIQKVIRAFPYKPRATNPSEIAVDQNINCLGASILGGSLMSEAGLKYLVGGLPGHALLFLVTTDGQVEWRDMQNLDTFFLSNQAIHGKNKNNADLAIEDIVDFEKNPTMEGLQFGIRTRDAAIGKKQEILVRMWGPEHGQKIQLLNNVGAILHDLGRYQEAIEAYNAVITTNPNWSMVYHNLGGALRKLNRNEEAIEAYRKAIENDPSSPRTGEYFLDLGKALSSLGRKDEAMEAYVQCTNLYSGDIADVAWAKIKELKNKQTF